MRHCGSCKSRDRIPGYAHVTQARRHFQPCNEPLEKLCNVRSRLAIREGRIGQFFVGITADRRVEPQNVGQDERVR